LKDSWIVAWTPDPDIKLTSERFRLELRFCPAAQQVLEKSAVSGPDMGATFPLGHRAVMILTFLQG